MARTPAASVLVPALARGPVLVALASAGLALLGQPAPAGAVPTQPGQITNSLFPPDNCELCHGYENALVHETDPDYSPLRTWQGTMMANSARDPVFWAGVAVADADSPGDTILCIRCHAPRAFLSGHGSITSFDELATVADEDQGVECEVCHRMVDPFYSAENPARDVDVLAALADAPTVLGSGAIVVDPEDERRGPFDLQLDWDTNPHSILGLDWPLQSPFHTEAALCGSCHDITNPVFSWDEGSQSYVANALDTPGDVSEGFPLERTYSEWLLSEYNTPQGVYAPQFGGNEPYVSTCQDCHMRKVTGSGGSFFGNMVERDNMPLHDLTGANTWVPLTLPLHPEFGDDFDQTGLAALDAGIHPHYPTRHRPVCPTRKRRLPHHRRSWRPRPPQPCPPRWTPAGPWHPPIPWTSGCGRPA